MNTKRVQAAEGVILAAMQTRQTAAGIAIALDSACLLQSPESALAVEVQSRELSAALAELKELRARVVELEAAQAQQLADAGDWLDDEPARPADPNHALLGHEYAVSHDLPAPADTPESLR